VLVRSLRSVSIRSLRSVSIRSLRSTAIRSLRPRALIVTTPVAAAVLVIASAAGASAHVTVHGSGLKEGGSGTLTLKVPNEEDGASTTRVEIDLPSDTPLTGVSAQAPAGWSSQVSADKVVFSGGKISGDNSVAFPIKVEKLPMSATVVFKALQTYSDGNVVRWIEQAPAGAAEPAHPAPTLHLQPAAGAASAAPSKESAAPQHVKSGTGGQAIAPMHGDDGDSDAAPAPKKVHAGTGGQAAEQSGASVPVVPMAAMVVGLAVAGPAAWRLARR
jgi:uncharacterized protein